MLTEERRAEYQLIVDQIRRWAATRPDVAAMAVVGSWARGAARMDSDLDVVVLTSEIERYCRDEAWVEDAVERRAGAIGRSREQMSGMQPSTMDT